jgi:hypothetical protein
VIQCGVELVDGVRPEGVAYLRPVKGDPYHGRLVAPVVGDVGEVEPFHLVPQVRRKRAGHDPKLAGSRSSSLSRCRTCQTM